MPAYMRVHEATVGAWNRARCRWQHSSTVVGETGSSTRVNRHRVRPLPAPQRRSPTGSLSAVPWGSRPRPERIMSTTRGPCRIRAEIEAIRATPSATPRNQDGHLRAAHMRCQSVRCRRLLPLVPLPGAAALDEKPTTFVTLIEGRRPFDRQVPCP